MDLHRPEVVIIMHWSELLVKFARRNTFYGLPNATNKLPIQPDIDSQPEIEIYFNFSLQTCDIIQTQLFPAWQCLFPFPPIGQHRRMVQCIEWPPKHGFDIRIWILLTNSPLRCTVITTSGSGPFSVTTFVGKYWQLTQCMWRPIDMDFNVGISPITHSTA